MKHIFLAFLTLASTVQAHAGSNAETNYCHDKAANQEWEQIKRAHRGERDVEGLYAFRTRLCREIEAGSITVREATTRFEQEREDVIRKRQERNRRREAGAVSAG